MSVVLVRIDDRLVHGQVVEGWLRVIQVDRIVVANDAVAVDEMQKALYTLAIPQGVELSCMSLQEASSLWKKTGWGTDRVLILISTPEDILSIVEQGVTLEMINVGGMHFKEGRSQVLRGVSVNARDIAALKALSKRGIFLEARPLPLDEPVDLRPYLEQEAKAN